MSDPVVNESLLPPQIRRMIRAMGLPATMTLLETLGGTRLPLPLVRNRYSRHTLARLIGEAAARAFYEEFGWQGVKEIMLPKVDKILRQARDAAIRAESDTQTVAQLALRYKLTMRQIQKIKRSAERPVWRHPAPQLSLFGEAP